MSNAIISLSHRRSVVLGALLCLGILAVPSAPAAVIVQDDFNGAAATPDPSKWAAPTDYPALAAGSFVEGLIDGGGHVDVSTAGLPTYVTARPSFLTAATGSVGLRLTMSVVNATTHFSLGFYDWGNHVIELRDDTALGGTAGHWSIYMSSNWPSSFDMFDTGITATSGTWQFDWTFTRVTLLFNNALTFDSAAPANAPTVDAGADGWNIPTAAMVPMAYTYAGPSGAGLVDSMLFESVALPEPSTMLLSGAGVMLVAKRRRR